MKGINPLEQTGNPMLKKTTTPEKTGIAVDPKNKIIKTILTSRELIKNDQEYKNQLYNMILKNSGGLN